MYKKQKRVAERSIVSGCTCDDNCETSPLVSYVAQVNVQKISQLVRPLWEGLLMYKQA